MNCGGFVDIRRTGKCLYKIRCKRENRITNARDRTKLMPPFFLRKCDCSNDEIYMNYSYIFQIMRLFFHKVSVVLNTFAKIE
jgi:hypothetical protein